MSRPILIWGAGAVGGTVGATLARAGRNVTFVDLVPEHVVAIRDPGHGLRVTGPVDQMTVVAPAFTPKELQGSWDRIFLAVKAQHTAEASRSLLPHLGPEGVVVSLQNGLCASVIADIVGRTRAIGTFINFGADWHGPGEILYGNRGAVAVGELDGTFTERLKEIWEDIRLFEPDAIMTDEIQSFLWGKLAYGSLLYAQAVGNLGIADCLARPELLGLWHALAGEVLQVARAAGVKPRGFNGFDPSALEFGALEAAAARSVAAMVAFNRPNAKTHSGVWRDLAVRKRRTDVDVQLGGVSAVGRRHQLACPKLDALVSMIHEIENGTRAISDSNLNELAA